MAKTFTIVLTADQAAENQSSVAPTVAHVQRPRPMYLPTQRRARCRSLSDRWYYRHNGDNTTVDITALCPTSKTGDR